MNVLLYGHESEKLRPSVEKHTGLNLVTKDPETVVCFGGDGTLLAAERLWPGVPKVPLRNSRRGVRCIGAPPEGVIAQLAAGRLVPHVQLKLACHLDFANSKRPAQQLVALNEVSGHMGRVTSSLRYRVWFDGRAYGSAPDHEIIGDGFVVCSPFGSTAYFNQITRGVFWQGIGVAFKYTNEQTTHVIVPEDTAVRVQITRGPAMIAHDSAPEILDADSGDVLTIRRAQETAVLLMPE
jgi:NAD+ kinase